MAYINITGECARPVGHLGLKKAEKDLIMRRYKYNHMNDNIQRVALIYGNPGSNSLGHQSNVSPYVISSGNAYISPYLNNQAAAASGNGNNISSILKRNKYMLDESGNSGGYIKLPRI
jgi:hypothetical protein